MATVPSSETPSDRLKFYDVNDLRQMFHVGRNKARLMMDALPSIRVRQQGLRDRERSKRAHRRAWRHSREVA